MTHERDRRLPWLLTGCVACGLAAFVFLAFVVSMTYNPTPGREPPKVTDWMQGWGSIAGVLAGVAAAVAAAWLLMHERQQAREAQEQLRAERAEVALRPVRNIFTSPPSVRVEADGAGRVEVYVWNLGLRPLLDIGVVVSAPRKGFVVLNREEILPPKESRPMSLLVPRGGLMGLTEGNARRAEVTVSYSELTGERWRRVNNGEPERLPKQQFGGPVDPS
ncbi:hypothetical protein [Plantactinospora sp. CA-290183]|uniref:hypothetical protein n=1 Tax=Plantactinospora sp. CA-290183 TaxID=3240006 RepID=UPI003D8EC312